MTEDEIRRRIREALFGAYQDFHGGPSEVPDRHLKVAVAEYDAMALAAMEVIGGEVKRLRKAHTGIAQGNCPSETFRDVDDAPSQADAQRVFHMAFTTWMQKIAREALKGG